MPSWGRQLKIGVAVIPATGGKSHPDPIVILMGGRGEDAISAAEVFVKQFTALRRDRDILLVDQRGTGRSGGLHCALFSAQEPAAPRRLRQSESRFFSRQSAIVL